MCILTDKKQPIIKEVLHAFEQIFGWKLSSFLLANTFHVLGIVEV